MGCYGNASIALGCLCRNLLKTMTVDVRLPAMHAFRRAADNGSDAIAGKPPPTAL